MSPPAPRLALLLLGALLVCGACDPGGRRPNVVLLLADQHRWHAMGHSETPGLETPALDRLAREGLSLRLAVSNAPVCAPARAMLLTGRWPHQTGVLDNGDRLRRGEPTLGSAFRAAGYATGFIGKWHLGGRSARPFGFDHSILWLESSEHWGSRYSVAGEPDVRYEGYNATGTTDQALAFLERHRAEPFLLVVSWNPPHPHYTDAPERFRERVTPGSLAYRANVPEDWRGRREAARDYAGYHAHVAAIDAELGRILEKLDALGIAGHTFLVYTSDHGDMLGSHGLRQKRVPYAESLRVPWLVRGPGVPGPGRPPEILLGSIDALPTLCGLAGVPAPPDRAGLDLSRTLRGEPGAPEPRSQLVMNTGSGGVSGTAPRFRGVRTRRYTYAIRADAPWLLFDDERDPLQLDNRVGDPALAALRGELAELTRGWLAASGDPFPLPASAWR